MSAHFDVVQDRAARSLTLPDILVPDLDLVFVGINPSIYSALRGQYFARPSNMFWRCLNASGLVPEPLGRSAVFVMPSPSGRANRLHAERLRCLRSILDELRGRQPAG